jgi:hypothetical protein
VQAVGEKRNLQAVGQKGNLQAAAAGQETLFGNRRKSRKQDSPTEDTRTGTK